MSKRLIITLSDELHTSVESMAKLMGVSAAEYTRFLLLKAVEKKMDDDKSEW